MSALSLQISICSPHFGCWDTPGWFRVKQKHRRGYWSLPDIPPLFLQRLYWTVRVLLSLMVGVVIVGKWCATLRGWVWGQDQAPHRGLCLGNGSWW